MGKEKNEKSYEEIEQEEYDNFCREMEEFESDPEWFDYKLSIHRGLNYVRQKYEEEKLKAEQEKKEQKDLINQRILKDLENKLILTPKEISVILGMGLNQVYSLFESKGFPSIDLNGKKFIEKEAFFKWLKELRGKSYIY